MFNRIRVVLAAGLLVGALVPSAGAEQRALSCVLDGAAKFKPGLSLTDQEYKVSFRGNLTDCQATGGETAGTVVAKVTAAGTCAVTSTEGIAKIKWDNGKKTKVTIATEDVGAVVALTFEVTKSSTPSLTAGDQGAGLLAFQADPTQCPADGITEATFDGVIGAGSPE